MDNQEVLKKQKELIGKVETLSRKRVVLKNQKEKQ